MGERKSKALPAALSRARRENCSDDEREEVQLAAPTTESRQERKVTEEEATGAALFGFSQRGRASGN